LPQRRLMTFSAPDSRIRYWYFGEVRLKGYWILFGPGHRLKKAVKKAVTTSAKAGKFMPL
jgi:hypothetical protein